MYRQFIGYILSVPFMISTLEATLPESDETVIEKSFNCPVVDVKDVNEEILFEIWEAEDPIILKFSKGTLIPLNITLGGNVVNTVPKGTAKIEFCVEHTLYIVFTDEDPLFSEDLLHWHPAYTFFQANFGCSFASSPEGLTINLEADINH